MDALEQALDADMTYIYVNTKQYNERVPEYRVSLGVIASDSEEGTRIQTEALQIYPSEDILALNDDDLVIYLVGHQLLEAQSQPELLIQPSLSRACGAGILGLIAKATETILLNFESVYCVFALNTSWHYAVDLNEEVFEIYRGIEWDRFSGFLGGRFDHLVYGERPHLVKRYTFAEIKGVEASDPVQDVQAALRTYHAASSGVDRICNYYRPGEFA